MKTSIAFPTRGGEACAAGPAVHSSHLATASLFSPGSTASLFFTNERSDDTPRFTTSAQAAGFTAGGSAGGGNAPGAGAGSGLLLSGEPATDAAEGRFDLWAPPCLDGVFALPSRLDVMWAASDVTSTDPTAFLSHTLLFLRLSHEHGSGARILASLVWGASEPPSSLMCSADNPTRRPRPNCALDVSDRVRGRRALPSAVAARLSAALN
jgi:hypothetical protein